MTNPTVITEGGLLPADVLDAIAAEELPGQRPEDFGLERGRNLSDRIAAAWQAARGHWMLFKTYAEDLRAGDAGTSITRQRWMLPLLDVLGYQMTFNSGASIVEGRTYAISHRAGEHADAPPVHIEGFRTSLDARPPSGRPRLSPHALVQEYLNSTEHLWGLVTNGERLRLLRDSSRFTRPAYVEFDLRVMFEGEQFSAFALLYRLLHRSRLPQTSADGSDSWLEQYHQQAIETGGRVREKLRDGVETALKTLGNGLLVHPANAALRQKLQDGTLVPLAYYRQLLKLVYRLLFLMVAEDRNLIAAEEDENERPLGDVRLAIYRQHYSVGRLRRLAEQPGAGRGPYDDLWVALQTTFRLLEGSDEQAPRSLGLAPLDGDLFGPEAIADLEGQHLRNADLLAAVRALSLYREKDSRSLRRVNYGALDVEELGSVYESLLDYRPVIAAQGQSDLADHTAVRFDLVAGTERKTTGSYYTRPELVQELIKSALVPVMEERLKDAGSDPQAREQALLAITVCDPACGSGHFLLAAARRLGRELARVRSGEEQPTPAQFRRAVRDVIQHCIYGVDLNPLAVDLCKLALWIEGHSAGLPLSFLDHHIKQGNSLIGATRALVEQGIPDDAYKAITGDDKKIASEVRKRNKQERELYLHGAQQHSLFDTSTKDDGVALAAELRRLDAMGDTSVVEVRQKAANYQRVRATAEAEFARFNLWTAAFFQPLTPANFTLIPTTQDLADHGRPKDLHDPKVAMATVLGAEVGFFHWELEFPQIFAPTNDQRPHGFSPFGANGFDVVLGNPPWEQIELREEEFFVDIPEIRDAINKIERGERIEAWRKGDIIQKDRVFQFERLKYQAESERRFIKESGLYILNAVGRLNTYALFTELSIYVKSLNGRTGIIIPTGIATDETYKEFFEYITNQNLLVSLFDFENRENIFPGVGHGRYKFSLLTLGYSNKPSQYCFFATRVQHLYDPLRVFILSKADISLINPNTLTCPVFRTNLDAQIVASIYRKYPVLINERSKTNLWNISARQGIFNITSDNKLFANKLSDDFLPMYEGNMVFIYDHRHSSYNENIKDYEINTNKTVNYSAKTQYFTPTSEITKRLDGRNWERNWFFGLRRVTRSTDERTLLGSLVPYGGVSYGLWLIFSTKTTDLYLCLLSVLNSLVCDYLCRTALSQPSLTYGVIKQLSVPPPSAFSPSDIAFIIPRVVELVYTAWDIRAFTEDVWAEADAELRVELLRRNAECNAGADPALFAPRDGFPLPPYRWSEERRAVARAELDARIARLYGLTRDELRYILDPHDVYGPDFPGETFRVLKDKELKQFKEYRTRRLVLEAWDREESRG